MSKKFSDDAGFSGDEEKEINDAIKLANVDGDKNRKAEFTKLLKLWLRLFVLEFPEPGHPSAKELQESRKKLSDIAQKARWLADSLRTLDHCASQYMRSGCPPNSMLIPQKQLDQPGVPLKIIDLRAPLDILSHLEKASTEGAKLSPSPRNPRLGPSRKYLFLTWMSGPWKRANKLNKITGHRDSKFVKFATALYSVICPDDNPTLDRQIKQLASEKKRRNAQDKKKS